MSELDERLRAHYARACLSEDRIQDLIAMHAATARPAHRGARRWLPGLGAALRLPERGAIRLVMCAMAVVVFLGVYHSGYRSGYQGGERLASRADLGERTLREVAMNHRTRFDPDYRDDSIASLDERMGLLPFSLSAPARLDAALQVQGSRYCSLAGQLAAHVTLRDAKRRPVSLFVTTLAHDVQRLDGLHERVAGLKVQLWQEEGLFYAMAHHE